MTRGRDDAELHSPSRSAESTSPIVEPSEQARGARILIIRQGYVPLDPRVRRELEALLHEGYEVDVICLRGAGEAGIERRPKLTIRRLPLSNAKGGFATYLVKYTAFLLLAMLMAAVLHARRRYRLVQVNTMPDVLVLAAAVPRLLGIPVLLDLHETMPEFFATKFHRRLDSPLVRVIGLLERMSISFATFAITCTQQMKEAFASRGAGARRIAVILNAANEELFDSSRFPPRESDSRSFTLICHGSIEDRYGIDTAVEAVAMLCEAIPGIQLRIIGDGAELPRIRQLVARLHLEGRVHFSNGFVPIDELLREIANADAGVVAMKRDAFRDLTHCNKMFDYVTMRRPAIVSRTRSVLAYFPEDCFAYFDAGDARDLARAAEELYRRPSLGEQMIRRAAEVNEFYRWPIQRDEYLRIVNCLLTGQTPIVSSEQPAHAAVA